MEITNITLCGFRNLDYISIDISKLTGLISLNNVGKSNILDGIHFGLNFIRATEMEKRGLFQKGIGNVFDINAITKPFSFVVSGTTTQGDKVFDFVYSYTLSYDSNLAGSILEESLRARVSGNLKFETLLKRDGSECFYKASITARCNTPLSINNHQLAINKLMFLDKIDDQYPGLINEINNINVYGEDCFDPRTRYQSDILLPKTNNSNLLDMDNLPRALVALREKNPNKFDLIKNAFLVLFPDIEDFDVQVVPIQPNSSTPIPQDAPFVMADNLCLPIVKMKYFPTYKPFNIVSDGTKRVLLIIAHAVLADEANIPLMLIEEPENTVHPSLLNAYVQVLSDITDCTKIIITSHSPYIISSLSKFNIYAGYKSIENGTATFHKLNNHKLIADAKESETSMGDYVFDVLANEDKELLRYYLVNKGNRQRV